MFATMKITTPFKDMKIGSRLIIGFSMIIALSIFASLFAIYEMKGLADLTDNLYNHPLIVSNALRAVNTTIIKMHRSMKDVVLATDEVSLESAIRIVDTHEKDIYEIFETIQERFLGEQREVEELTETFTAWRPIRNEVIALIREGKRDDAAVITKGKGFKHVNQLERQVNALIAFANTKAADFLEDANIVEHRAYQWTISLLCIMVFIGMMIAVIISRMITRPLKIAVAAAEQIAKGDVHVEFPVTSKDEVGQVLMAMKTMIAYIQNVANVAEKISQKNLQVKITPKSDKDILNHSFIRMVATLQNMIKENTKAMRDVEQQNQTMKQQNWLKDGISQLNAAISGESTLQEVCQKATSFTARYINAGCGAMYVYNAKDSTLKLYGTFAFTKRNELSNKYRLGEGVVGQVALERKPILLKQVLDENGSIMTGILREIPLQTYTFPLIYEDQLYGVFELASSEPIEAIKQEFLNEANRVIATVLFSAFQKERGQELIRLANKAAEEANHAKTEAERQAENTRKANIRLEQQQQLEQQNEEFQQIAIQSKEQQQLKQQQK